MRTASWILLTVVGALLLTFSLLSASVAYMAPEREILAEKKLADAGLSPELQKATLARRGTAAAYAAAFATLFLFIATGPYRRREVWAWWALLSGLVVLNLVTLPRIPQLGMNNGVQGPAILFTIGLIGLLLDVRRLSRKG
jgi:hypothetical protein